MPVPATSDELLAALDPEQREVATALRGPVRVLAGAGTGKTRAITHRIAYGVSTGVYKPNEVLAVTFTTRAAGEMRQRLSGLGVVGVQARTFHSAALRQARYFWPKVYGADLPSLIDSKLPLVGRAARSNRVETDAGTLRDLASEIEWAKVSNVRPDDYARVAPGRGRSISGVDPASIARVFDSYEQLKREAVQMDMEDVLLCCAGLLADDERVAASVRRQYTHFVVDEFQDVSPLQSALLDLWLGGRDSLCVVGDPAQTIYSFAGANARYLLDFPQKHRGAASIELVRNYRSTPQVIDTANRLLAGSSTGAVRLRSQQEAGADVRYAEYADEVAEAEAVGARIKELVEGGLPPSEVAVLVRINAQSEVFEEALAARQIPYVVRGAERFFHRGEVRQAVTLLRGSARAGESEATVGDSARAVLAGMGWKPDAPEGRGNARDKWESLQALIDLADAFEGDLGAFVDELDRRAADQHAPVADGVTVATMHAAKGLEWDAVFVAGVVEGTLPIIYAETPAAVEEERRLLYVGLTRARRELSVSWARARQPGGRGTRKPSRFLDGLRPEVASDRPQQRSSKKSLCRVCNQALQTVGERKIGRHDTCESAYDEELFERLREWRKATADEASVPAYVVFTDRTLQAIAEVRPTDKRGLLQISGVGQSKWEKYGEDVLAMLA